MQPMRAANDFITVSGFWQLSLPNNVNLEDVLMINDIWYQKKSLQVVQKACIPSQCLVLWNTGADQPVA